MRHSLTVVQRETLIKDLGLLEGVSVSLLDGGEETPICKILHRVHDDILTVLSYDDFVNVFTKEGGAE